jgi:3-hydroxyacyl-CoA dehydrogenase
LGVSGTIQTEQSEGVAVLRLDRPVANALSPDLRAALLAALDAAEADDTCRAVVLAGAGTGFSSGVDLTEYEAPGVPPSVADLCDRIEGFAKPVVAGLHGSALGAGLALALAAHGRVAQAATRLALPEIGLGMMPGAGVTQRLPRLVGAQAALEFMLSGQPARADDPRLRRLFDQITEDPPEAAARALAARLAEAGHWVRPCDVTRGFSDPVGYQRAIADVRDRMPGQTGAAADILRAVEAAQLLPAEQGCAFEAVLFEERLRSPEARAQRHVYAAERRAAGLPELRRGQVREIARVGLSGRGLGEVALVLLAGGRTVWSDDPELPAALRRTLDARVARGQLRAEARDDWLARLSGDSAGRRADLWLAAEGVAAEPGLFARLDMGAGFAGPGVGLRLYPPVGAARCAEIGVPEGQPGEADTVASLARLMAALRITVLRAARPEAGPGLGHVMEGALRLAALQLMRAGLAPPRIDAAAQRLGLRTGPFLAMDEDGLAEVAPRLHRVADILGLPGDVLAPLADRIDKGAAGRAVGRGFYDHPPDGPRAPREFAGAAEVTLPGEVTVRHALHAALVNAAERLLAAGAVQRASDLDVVMVCGLGYARRRGGPLCHADQRGLMAVLKDMKALSPMAPPLWSPRPGILERVKLGEGYFSRAGAAREAVRAG